VNQFYVDAARLLIQVAPVVFESGVFALKGGTAINLFVRDMPRLSVDLDLVFPDHSLPRDQALAQINAAVRQASARLKTRGFQVRTVTPRSPDLRRYLAKIGYHNPLLAT
jgi:predicted nucleotidyltransferase component of viral defense system